VDFKALHALPLIMVTALSAASTAAFLFIMLTKAVMGDMILY